MMQGQLRALSTELKALLQVLMVKKELRQKGKALNRFIYVPNLTCHELLREGEELHPSGRATAHLH